MEEARQKYGFEAEKTVAQLQDKQQERAHKAQMFNAESQLRVQTGPGYELERTDPRARAGSASAATATSASPNSPP